jgi:hypothetical protein
MASGFLLPLTEQPGTWHLASGGGGNAVHNFAPKFLTTDFIIILLLTYVDTDHYLVVAEVRERLAVSERAAQKIDTERFSYKKVNESDVKEQD